MYYDERPSRADRTLSPNAAGCLLVALGPLRRARRMSKTDEEGDEHEHAKVGLRELDEGHRGRPSQVVGLELRAGAPCALPAPSRGPTRHLGCLCETARRAGFELFTGR